MAEKPESLCVKFFGQTEMGWEYPDLAMIAGLAAHTLDGLLVGAGSNMQTLEDLLEYISQQVCGSESEAFVNQVLVEALGFPPPQDTVANNPGGSTGHPKEVRPLHELCSRIALAARSVKLSAPSYELCIQLSLVAVDTDLPTLPSA